ncbi:MAG: hypothetical protein AB7O28_11515 [Vicinamibacterales bacterium]
MPRMVLPSGVPAGPWIRAAGRLLAALLAVLLLDGCAAHRRLAIPGQPPRAGAATAAAGGEAATLRPGDHVRIRLQSGTVLRVTLAEVRSDALVTTRGQRIPFEAMARLEKRHLSVVRTAILVGGGLGLLVLVMTAAAYASLASGL